MLARVYTTVLSVLFFALLAVATPAPWGAPPPVTVTVTTTTTSVQPGQTSAPSQCNTGPIQCCDQVQEVKIIILLLRSEKVLTDPRLGRLSCKQCLARIARRCPL